MGVLKELYFDILEGEEMETTYFDKLYEVSGMPENYRIVMMELYRKEFYSLVDHDENREADALEQRDFIGGEITGPARLLEVMVGLAARMDSILGSTDGDRESIKNSFWEIFVNLGLEEFTDCRFCNGWMPCDFSQICEKLLKREYEKNGKGGFFPLICEKNHKLVNSEETKIHKLDQRKVEIWYQMQAYLAENYPI